MPPIVLGFAGRIASGKSLLSTAVAARFQQKRVGFGDYVRRVANDLGLDSSDRNTLQDVGDFLLKYPRAFCTKVLEQAHYQLGDGLVIDGLRHQEIVNELRTLVLPTRFVLIYVAADDQTIEPRLRQRGQSLDDLHCLERHATERQVRPVLAETADIRIVNDDDRSPEDVLEELLHLLRPYST